MRTRPVLAVVLCTLLFVAGPIGAQRDDAEARARAIGADLVERGCPGVSIAVGVDGELVFAEGFGWSDLEQRVPVTAESRFRIGSVSKPVTAAAAVRLMEEERLDLDAPIQTYVPSFHEHERDIITVRLLGGHLGGIRHYRGLEFLSDRRYHDPLDALDVFADDLLVAPPGERYSYSTYGWTLLSAAVQDAAEREFLDALEDLVFGPLGMESTGGDHNDEVIPGRVRFYARSSRGEVVNAPHVDLSNKWAGGGLLAPMSDLVRFGSGHLETGYLSDESHAVLFTSQYTTDGEATGYGFGWSLSQAADGTAIRSHTGGSVGGTTAFLIHPESGVVVGMAANLTGAPLGMRDARDVLAAFREAGE